MEKSEQARERERCLLLILIHILKWFRLLFVRISISCSFFFKLLESSNSNVVLAIRFGVCIQLKPAENTNWFVWAIFKYAQQ